MPYLLTLFLLLNSAHVFSPIVMSWSHSGYRRIMLDNPWRYIVPPAAIFLVGAAIAVMTSRGWIVYVPVSRALSSYSFWPTMIKLFFLWDFWHFAMQNYGLLRLCRLRNKAAAKLLAFVGTAAGIWYVPTVISAHHWITDLGLSARVMGRKAWLFILCLTLMSPVAFLWDRAPWLWPQLNAIALRQVNALVILFIGLHFSLQVVHYIVSRQVWKLSDPLVRATIGSPFRGRASANYATERCKGKVR